MNRADVFTRLKTLEARLRVHGVALLYVYGSYARDDARPSSDIDILADFAADKPPDLSRFMDAYHERMDAFPGTEIGFGTRDSLVPIYRPHIESTIVRVF